ESAIAELEHDQLSGVCAVPLPDSAREMKTARFPRNCRMSIDLARIFPGRAGAILLAAMVGLLAASPVRADDWPQWLGPKADGVWREGGIVKKFSTSGMLPRVWSYPIAEGYTGPAVADGKVYVMDYVRNERIERVLCLDAHTGKELWKHTYPVR